MREYLMLTTGPLFKSYVGDLTLAPLLLSPFFVITIEVHPPPADD